MSSVVKEGETNAERVPVLRSDATWNRDPLCVLSEPAGRRDDAAQDPARRCTTIVPDGNLASVVPLEREWSQEFVGVLAHGSADLEERSLD